MTPTRWSPPVLRLDAGDDQQGERPRAGYRYPRRWRLYRAATIMVAEAAQHIAGNSAPWNGPPATPAWAIAALTPARKGARADKSVDLGYREGHRRQAMADLDNAVRRWRANDGRHEAPFKVAALLGKYVHYSLITEADLEKRRPHCLRRNGALDKYKPADIKRRSDAASRRRERHSSAARARSRAPTGGKACQLVRRPKAPDGPALCARRPHRATWTKPQFKLFAVALVHCGRYRLAARDSDRNGTGGPRRRGGAHEGPIDPDLRCGNRIGRRVVKPASWPRYMVEKSTRAGIAYYWRPPGRDVAKECPVHAEALGSDYGGAVARARFLNEHLDAWRNGLGEPKSLDLGGTFGTIDWWIETYLRTDAYTNLSVRSRADYRDALERLADLQTNLTDARTGSRSRVGALPVASLSPAAVDKLYSMLRAGGAVRQANYPIDVARRAWKVVARKYPAQFLIPNPTNPSERMALNPFVGVERVRGEGTTEPASRLEAYALAETLAGVGHPTLGAAALICYEWLQRPENVLAGKISWTDYRPAHHPLAVR